MKCAHGTRCVSFPTGTAGWMLRGRKHVKLSLGVGNVSETVEARDLFSFYFKSVNEETQFFVQGVTVSEDV